MTDDDDETGPVRVPIEDALDLHPFAPREIPSVVESYLEAAAEVGFRVERFGDAPADRGGWGATFVWLRPPR